MKTVFSVIAQFVMKRLFKKLALRLSGNGEEAVWISRSAADWAVRLAQLLKNFIAKKMKVRCVKKTYGECSYRQCGCFVMDGKDWLPEDFAKCEYLKNIPNIDIDERSF